MQKKNRRSPRLHILVYEPDDVGVGHHIITRIPKWRYTDEHEETRRRRLALVVANVITTCATQFDMWSEAFLALVKEEMRTPSFLPTVYTDEGTLLEHGLILKGMPSSPKWADTDLGKLQGINAPAVHHLIGYN